MRNMYLIFDLSALDSVECIAFSTSKSKSMNAHDHTEPFEKNGVDSGNLSNAIECNTIDKYVYGDFPNSSYKIVNDVVRASNYEFEPTFRNSDNLCGDIEVVNVWNKDESETLDWVEKDYLDNILTKMSDDESKWQIHPVKRQPTKSKSLESNLQSRYWSDIEYDANICTRCRDIGHDANQCRKKSTLLCCLCSERGHLERDCPNKACTNCGRGTKHFTTLCSRCSQSKNSVCGICNMRGHDRNICPDLWRRYHLTTYDGPIIRPTAENGGQTLRWCSGCGKEEHLEFQCQYFKRDHCPTVPDVINYQDHLYKEHLPTLSSVSETSAWPLLGPSTSDNGHILESDQISSASDCIEAFKNLEVNSYLTSTCKSILTIPQPIELDPFSQETEIDVMMKSESSFPTPLPHLMSSLFFQQPTLFHPPPLLHPPQFFQTPPILPAAQYSSFLICTQLQISYLHSKYLRLHKCGISTIHRLSSLAPIKIQVHSDGLITIRGLLETSSVFFKSVILNHLQSIRHLTMPIEKLPLISFLEEILLEVSKDYTVQDLRTCFSDLQDDIFSNKSISFQRLNIMIYGYFKWEYGALHTDTVRTILNRLWQSDSISSDSMEELKKCLQYLIEFERPICIYQSIIENISNGITSIVNFPSLQIPDELPSQKALTIAVDPIKYEYVKVSFPAKFMICRWKTKLDVTIHDEIDRLLITLEGSVEDVSNAFEEYQMLVGDGPMLPLSKWGIFNIVSHLLEHMNTGQNLNKSMIRRLLTDEVCYTKNTLKAIHTYLIVTCGMNSGREKMTILQEYVNNYKPSTQTDYLSEIDRRQMQEAFDTIQFKGSNDIADYRPLYMSICQGTVDTIVLYINEYTTLKETKEVIPWCSKLIVSPPQIINSQQICISLDGTDENRRNFKVHIFNYLDRADIFDSNPQSLHRKLENSLKKLWIKPIKSVQPHKILGKILRMESMGIHSYHIENVRKLYHQLHMYLFGCCKLLLPATSESTNHVYALRAYIAYLGTINVLPDDDVKINIYKTYNYIFGKEKINGVDYKRLVKNAWKNYKKYELLDQNTIFISCSPSFKSYLKQYASLLSHSSVERNPTMQYRDVQTFVNDAFMIIINTDMNFNHNTLILNRSEFYKLFSEPFRNISTTLSISLQAVDNVQSYFNNRKAMDLLHHIIVLEENSPGSEIIAEKYRDLNLYLFGCCQLMDGLRHMNILKTWHMIFSEPDKADQYITDNVVRNTLINSFEYIFFKGKKREVNYRMLVNKAGLISENTTSTIPLSSKHIYDYFKHVKEGINLIRECSNIVKVDIVYNENENVTLLQITGNSNALSSATDLLLNEIDRISIYKDIPFQIDPLCNYLFSKIEEVMNHGKRLIPLTTKRDLDAIQLQINPSLPYLEYIKLCARKESLCYQLSHFSFNAYELVESNPTSLSVLKHLDSLRTFAMELGMKPDIILDLNQIVMVYESLKYLFPKELDIDVYVTHIDQRVNGNNHKETARKLNLLPFIYDYLKDNGTVSLPHSRLQFEFDGKSPYILVSASDLYLNWMRNIFCEYNQILSKIPPNRSRLIIFLKKAFSLMQELNDPKSTWTNIRLMEQYDSHTNELNELYVNLHRHLLGYNELKKGKDLKEILHNHLMNLNNSNDTSYIISMRTLEEIFYALQYIEGSKKQFSCQEYEDLINESCNKSRLNIQSNHSEYEDIYATEVTESKLNSSEVCGNKIIALASNDVLTTNLHVSNDFHNIIQKDEHDCATVQIREHIPDGFNHYLYKAAAGKLFLNQLEELVSVAIHPQSVLLSGTISNVMTARNTLRQHYKTACCKLRTKIIFEISGMRQREHFHINDMRKNVLHSKAPRKIRYRLAKNINAYLYGTLKLGDGKYHMTILTNYLNSKETRSHMQMETIRASFNYLFKPSKPTDYASVIKIVSSKHIEDKVNTFFNISC